GVRASTRTRARFMPDKPAGLKARASDETAQLPHPFVYPQAPRPAGSGEPHPGGVYRRRKIRWHVARRGKAHVKRTLNQWLSRIPGVPIPVARRPTRGTPQPPAGATEDSLTSDERLPTGHENGAPSKACVEKSLATPVGERRVSWRATRGRPAQGP